MANTEKMDISKAIVEETKKSPIKKKKKSKKSVLKDVFNVIKKLECLDLHVNVANYFVVFIDMPVNMVVLMITEKNIKKKLNLIIQMLISIKLMKFNQNKK